MEDRESTRKELVVTIGKLLATFESNYQRVLVSTNIQRDDSGNLEMLRFQHSETDRPQSLAGRIIGRHNNFINIEVTNLIKDFEAQYNVRLQELTYEMSITGGINVLDLVFVANIPSF